MRTLLSYPVAVMASIVPKTSRNPGADTPVPGQFSGRADLRERARPRPVPETLVSGTGVVGGYCRTQRSTAAPFEVMGPARSKGFEHPGSLGDRRGSGVGL